ncbi:hypothetical protein PCANB_000206 [Pneumocystis canis]|nr:hypothetical protein PCANB_000206 [Pneumocystis canis]
MLTQHSLLKRQRLNENSGVRRQIIGSDEQKRGQRFLGTLMGTLGKFQKESAFFQEKNAKRAEIEARLAECMRKEKEEIEERIRMEQDEKLRRAERLRQESLREFERMSLETYYKNEMAAAHALKTETLPVLFYQPWKLSPVEEEKAKIRVQELEKVYHHALKKLEERLSLENSIHSSETQVPLSKTESINHNEMLETLHQDEITESVTNLDLSNRSIVLDQNDASFLTDPPPESIHDSKGLDHTEDMVEY